MSLASTPAVRFIGCDVGKIAIVVFDSASGQTRTIANQPEALARFASELDNTCLVVCEATGGYEAALLGALLDAAVPAHRADARKVKAFIRSFGTLGKTDALDAKALARYAQERQALLPRWRARDPDRVVLQALVLTRRDLVQQQLAFSNRRLAPGAQPVHPYIDDLLDCLARQIKAIEIRIEAILQASQSLKLATSILTSIPGIGPRTAAALIALMPELGSLNRRQAAALAGLAPHPRQSGNSDPYRRTAGGRPEIKRILFMAALSAARHHPKLRTFFLKLTSNGKKPILAITALMRKLIVIANAILRPLHI
jgi:transposase